MHVQLLNLCGYEEYHASHIFELGMFGKNVVMDCAAAHCITPVDVLAHFLCCAQRLPTEISFRQVRLV